MIMGTSTLQEQYDYRENQKNFWDINNVIETAEMKGEKKSAIKIARNLLSMNMPIDSICKATGLSADEINQL